MMPYYRLYGKKSEERLKELDKICPMCQTAENTVLVSAEDFDSEFFTEDFSIIREDPVPVRQETYVCTLCSKRWKGLAYSGQILKHPKTYAVFTQTAKIRSELLEQLWTIFIKYFTAIAIAGILLFVCTAFLL